MDATIVSFQIQQAGNVILCKILFLLILLIQINFKYFQNAILFAMISIKYLAFTLLLIILNVTMLMQDMLCKYAYLTALITDQDIFIPVLQVIITILFVEMD